MHAHGTEPYFGKEREAVIEIGATGKHSFFAC